MMLICRRSEQHGRPGLSLCRLVRAAGLAASLLSLAVPKPAVPAAIPDGIWLVESDSALHVFDCNGLLCGSVVWLRNARDSTGQIQRDKKNPDPALRQRLLCGLTVLWGLRPSGAEKWAGGWFYNPDDGKTYRITATFRPPDAMVARIYLGMPLFGETRILRRVPRLDSEGWC
jgi:uncharacterized protein (DUF2147 family)